MNEFLKRYVKLFGIFIVKTLGLTFFIYGVTEDVLWIIVVSFILVDITPSYFKQIISNVKYSHNLNITQEDSK